MSPNQISRRELLKWASAGAGAAAVGSATYLFGRDDPPEPTAEGSSLLVRRSYIRWAAGETLSLCS